MKDEGGARYPSDYFFCLPVHCEFSHPNTYQLGNLGQGINFPIAKVKSTTKRQESKKRREYFSQFI